MMAAWAIIRPDGYVESCCEWDGVVWNPDQPELGGWTPPEDRMMVLRPDFTWTVDGFHIEEDDPESGLQVFSACVSTGWMYEGGSDGLGVWKDPANQWQFSYVNGEWVKEDYA